MDELEKLSTLEQVMAWASKTDSELVSVITMDEYTHDVVFSVTGPDRFVVFDTT